MASADTKHKCELKKGSSSDDCYIQKTDKKPWVAESWAAKLSEFGFPSQLIKLVKKAEFEDWVSQTNHMKGNGLFYSGKFEDLPPRFQKKFIEIAHEFANQKCSPTEIVSKLTGDASSLEFSEKHNCQEPRRVEFSNASHSLSSEYQNKERNICETCSSESTCCDCSASQQVTRTSKDYKVDVSEKGKEGANTDHLQGFKLAAESIQGQSPKKQTVAFSGKHSKSFPYRTKRQDQNEGLLKHGRYPSKHGTTTSYTYSRRNNSVIQSPISDKNTENAFQASGHQTVNDYSQQDSDDNSCFARKPKANIHSSLLKHGRYPSKNNVTKSCTYSKRNNSVIQSPISSKNTEKAFQTSGHQNINDDSQQDSNDDSYFARKPKANLSKQFSKPLKTSENECFVGKQSNLKVPHHNHSFFTKEEIPASKNSANRPQLQKYVESSANRCSQKESDVNDISEVSDKKSSSYTGGSYKRINSSDVRDCNQFDISVSDKVDDIKYWANYVESIIKHNNFKITASSAAKSLHVVFPDSDVARQAHYNLKKINKHVEEPHITEVSNIKTLKTKVTRITREFQHEIITDRRKRIFAHESKIKVVEVELNSLKLNSPNRMQITAVEAKLQLLLDMRKVFINYTDNILKKMSTFSQTEFLQKTASELKKDFVHECNCLDGCLPIYSKKEEILDTVSDNQVSVIVADTGSGKSTQLVQYLYRGGYAESGIIVCTQPRKIAAISLCKYVSGQLGSAPGELVGYEAGLKKKVNQFTKIVFMTDYMLLRKCINKKEFDRISCVIVDEAHERSLYTDLLFGMLKRILENQKNVKVIITSATIDPAVFVNYFKASADSVVRVPGKIYPVTVKWHNENAYIGCNYLQTSVECAYDIHCQSEEGGILVFLTSPEETEEAVEMFKSMPEKETLNHSGLSPVLLCLHGKLDTEDQMKIFDPASKGYRKIIFATNSAETSLTIPDIKYVVDSGMSKELRYDEVKKRNALVVGFVSRTSAEQRKGRAGRTQPGFCYRMYTQENFKCDMVDVTPPEILRCPLQEALLKILDMRIQPENFDFISAPPRPSVADAMHSLKLLGAVEGKHLTSLGMKIAKLPLPPQLAKLIIKGVENGIGYEAVIIAALITVSGRVFSRTVETKAKADEEKFCFCHADGDFYTFLIVFHEWIHISEHKRSKWCAEHFVNMKAMLTASKMVDELCLTLWSELNISFSKTFQSSSVFREKLPSVLFECFSENICVFSGHEGIGYISPVHGDYFFIHPSSALSYLGVKAPQFVIYSIALYTSRNFIVNVVPVTENMIVKAHQEGKFNFPIDLLKSMQVLPVVHGPVGDVVLVRHVLGKDGSKIKELEKRIRFLLKSNNFHINVSVEKGKVISFTEQPYQKEVSAEIEKVIKAGRSILSAAEEILHPPGSAPYHFAVGTGGYVHEVILPGESREVIIKNIQNNNINVQKVCQMLEKYGTLVSHHEIKSSFPALSVTYKKVTDANKAILGFQHSKVYQVSHGKAKIFERKDKAESLFRISVTWCRLPCKGSGFIDFFCSTDCIEASYKLTVNSIYIGDNYLTIVPIKGSDKTLKMCNLPENAEEQDVKIALKNHLPNHVRIKSISLVRDQLLHTSENELSIQKKKLHQAFLPYMSTNNCQIDLQMPNPTDTTWSAVIYFKSFEDGEKAVSALQGRLTLGRHKANVSVILKSSLRCRLNIYNVIRIDVESCRKKYEASGSNIVIKPHGTYVVIVISCKNVKHLAEMRTEIIKLIQGHQIACSKNPKLIKLFAQRTRVSFEDIESATKTYIAFNSVYKTISIYGSMKSCKEAEQLITSMSLGSSVLKTKIFDLHGCNMPSGFLKTLYKRYGFHLDGLIKKYHLISASIDLERHHLILEGKLKHISEAEDHLEDICSEMYGKTNVNEQTEEKEFCPVCFDEIFPIDSIRLENCGHAVCKLCLELQMKSEVIPVVCVKQDCGKPFFVEDFRKIFASQGELKVTFSNTALQHFIKNNPSEVHCCPTPDCSMIYRVESKDVQIVCPCCENTICTRCHSLFHHGMSCSMYQNIRLNEDYSLEVWLKEDTSNRKMCPVCSVAIEKDGGCNHVICSNCHKDICWLCLRVFREADEVYNHMPYCPHNT